MTVRHMMVFRAVCDAGFNSTKAAELLHMTQPAVSLAIKELEQYYGIKLFDRLGRRLQITDAGKHFLQYAESTQKPSPKGLASVIFISFALNPLFQITQFQKDIPRLL